MAVDNDDIGLEDKCQDVEEEGVKKLIGVTHPLDVILGGPDLGEPGSVAASLS